jgi:hypothetical protein
MKKIIMILSVAVMTMSNISCSNEKDNDLKELEIEGSWKVTSSDGTIKTHLIKDGYWGAATSGTFGFFLYEDEDLSGANINVILLDDDGIGTFVSNEDVLFIYESVAGADTWTSNNNTGVYVKVTTSRSGDYFTVSFSYDDGATKIEGNAINVWMI